MILYLKSDVINLVSSHGTPLKSPSYTIYISTCNLHVVPPIMSYFFCIRSDYICKKTEVRFSSSKFFQCQFEIIIDNVFKDIKFDLFLFLHLLYKSIVVKILTLVCIFIDTHSQNWKQIEPLFFLCCSISCIVCRIVSSLFFLLLLLP